MYLRENYMLPLYEMGLLEEPTKPAIYPATAENKKPAMTIKIAIKAEIEAGSTMRR